MDKIFLKTEAKKYAKEIKDKYKPEKIIIFGSLAMGKIKSGSDIDFFIVKKTNKPRWERQREVSRILINRRAPVDIIVFTPKEAEKRIKMEDPFISNIFNFGKVVYAKR